MPKEGWLQRNPFLFVRNIIGRPPRLNPSQHARAATSKLAVGSHDAGLGTRRHPKIKSSRGVGLAAYCVRRSGYSRVCARLARLEGRQIRTQTGVYPVAQCPCCCCGCFPLRSVESHRIASRAQSALSNTDFSGLFLATPFVNSQ